MQNLIVNPAQDGVNTSAKASNDCKRNNSEIYNEYLTFTRYNFHNIINQHVNYLKNSPVICNMVNSDLGISQLNLANAELKKQRLLNIGKNHLHLTNAHEQDNDIELASVYNGRNQYLYGIPVVTPSNTHYEDVRSMNGFAKNYGVYGGTVQEYYSIPIALHNTGNSLIKTTIDEIEKGVEISAPMLQVYTRQ